MVRITIDVDLSPEVEITGYQRYQEGHGLEVRWPLPVRCRCENVATTTSPTSSSKQAPRRSGTSTCGSSPVSGFTKLPSIAVRGVTTGSTLSPRSNARTCPDHLSLRAVRAPLADRQHGGGGCPSLGNLGQTVDRIVENQLTEDRQIDPQRVITGVNRPESLRG